MDISNLFIISAILRIAGEVIIATIVLRVHLHVLSERSIDADVLEIMKRERFYGVAGILLIVISFILEVYAYTLG
jgi:hypothetical protein